MSNLPEEGEPVVFLYCGGWRLGTYTHSKLITSNDEHWTRLYYVEYWDEDGQLAFCSRALDELRRLEKFTD